MAEQTAPANPISERNPPPRHASFLQSAWFIFVVALGLRLAFITIAHTYRITPRRDHFQFGWEMGRLARSIALGRGFSSPTDLDTGPSAWAPPLYPYVLGGVFRIFGIYSAASAWIILAFNSLFASLTCITLSRIAEKVYGATVASACAWTWALFPYAIYWSTRVVWETSLTTFLLTLALLLTICLERGTRQVWGWLLYGLLWGVILLTNTAVVSIMPFCLLWIWAKAAPSARRRVALGSFICLVVAGLVILPWILRNERVFGHFVFVRDNLPLELHMANNDRGDGLWTRAEHPGNDAASMRRFQEIGEVQFMLEKQTEFCQFVKEHPTGFLRFSLQRAIYFWIGTPQLVLISSWDLIYARYMGFFLYSAAAFAGLWLTLRQRRTEGLLFASLLLFYPLPYYLVNPFPRYKHPIEPIMVMLVVFLLSEAAKVKISCPLFHKAEV